MNSAGEKKMGKRFVAVSAGRRADGSDNFGVKDTQPALGSDGHCGDFVSMADAELNAAERNARWATVSEPGRVWERVQGRHFYAWLRPTPTVYLDV